MIHDLSEGTKHFLDFVALLGVAVAGVSLATAATFMALLAATCSVIWFAVRMYDRVKYGPGMGE